MDEEAPLKWPEDRDKFWETDPEYRDFAAMLEELNAETDRGVVLVATAFVDDLLGRLLAAFLLENESSEILLNGFNAPLGTLATKIAGCHAMGLITDGERLECHLLRRVRNEFAHQVKASFADNKIRDLCSNLTISEAVKESTKSPRQQFARAAITLMVGLLNRPHYVRQRPLKYGQWEQQPA
jgi:mannitol operon repressor